MHVLVLNQFHRQPGRGGTSRWNELAAEWTREGHTVTVVCSTVDHQSGTVPAEYRGRWVTLEGADGAQVRRTWTLGAEKSRAGGRITRDLSYAATALTSTLRLSPKPDIVIASLPPLFTGLAGVALARRYRAPLVVELRDLWADYVTEMDILRPWAARGVRVLEDGLCRVADHVVTVTPAFGERVHAKGVPPERVHVIPNGADLRAFHSESPDASLRADLGWGDRFTFLYAGVLGPSQALEHVIEAAARLPQDSTRVVFAGDGSERERLRARADEVGAGNVQFLGQLPREQVPGLLRAADAAVVSLRDVPSFRNTVPAKLFEAMACGKPVVLAAAGTAADIVTRAGGGAVARPGDVEALTRAMAALAEDPEGARSAGKSGEAFVRDHYDRSKLAAQYLELLESFRR